MSHGNARPGGGGSSRRPERGGGGGNPYDDAALARALQEEYEREYRRRSMQQHLGTDDSVPARSSSARVPALAAPTHNSRSASARGAGAMTRAPTRPEPSAPAFEPFYAPAEDVTPDLNFVLSGDTFGSVEVSDAAFARQLQREEEEERAREMRKQHLQQQRDSFRATRTISMNSTNSSQSPAIAMSRSNTTSFSSQSNASMLNPPRTFQQRDVATAAPERSSRNFNTQPTREQSLYPVVTGTNAYSDEDYARRLEQELRDEEVARQTFAEEQIRQSSLSAQAMYGNQGHNARGQRPRGRCYNFRRCLSCCITLILSVILAALLYVFVFGQESTDGWNFDPDQFRAEDPFNQANKEDANLWKTNGGKGGVGLELIVMNSLDQNWHDSFYLAVQQWDAGTPDSLTLQIEEGTPESVCSPETGKLKVCNGNYGETNWRGINKVLLENGWIYSSAARMNEFYSSDNDVDQMQYTMCHEMGHGFGLPHTDENFFNKDLNNCMDYTNNPKNNKQPAEPNFIFLSQLYGTVDGSPVPPADNSSNSTSVTASAEDPQNGATEDEGSWTDIFKPFGNRRSLTRKSQALNRRSLERSESIPPSVAAALEEVDHLIDSGALFSVESARNNGWRRLHQSSHGEAHELDLGEGFTVRINLLR